MEDNKSIRIKDIAKLAGVSVGTVDRVIHNRGNVSEKAQKKVKAVLEQIEYQPNLIARTLGSNKRKKIIALIPDPSLDEYWSLPSAGIKQTIAQWSHYGLEIIPMSFDLYDPESFKATSEEVVKASPDAVLIAPIFYRESLIFLKTLDESGIPYILFNTRISEANALCFIGQNLYESGRVAAELLTIGQQKECKLAVLHVFEDIDNSIHLKEKEIGVADYIFEQGGNHLDLITMDTSDPEDPSFESQFLSMILEKNVRGILVTTSKGVSIAASILKKHQLHEVRLVGYDLLEKNMALLQEGNIDFLINQNPNRQAQLGVDYLAQHLLFNQDLPREDLFPLEVITRQNLASYIRNLQSSLKPQVTKT